MILFEPHCFWQGLDCHVCGVDAAVAYAKRVSCRESKGIEAAYYLALVIVVPSGCTDGFHLHRKRVLPEVYVLRPITRRHGMVSKSYLQDRTIRRG